MRRVIISLCGLVFAVVTLAKSPPTDDSIEIIEARFGAFNQWVDVTEQLEAQMTAGRLDLNSLEPILEGIEDPTIGHPKTLVVAYRHQGEVRLKMVANDRAATRWGPLVLPEPEEVSQLRVRLYVDNTEQPRLDRTIDVGQRFDLESRRGVSLSGRLRRDNSGTLRFKGTATHQAGSSQFDGTVAISEPLVAKSGAFAGGIAQCSIRFDQLSTQTDEGTRRTRSAAVKQALERYETSLLHASREFQQRSGSATETLTSELEKIRKSTSATEEFHVVAAFYGQNVSWIEVTEKVRKAVGKKNRWAADVRTDDWGEPAPGFGGPRTLLVAYFAGGKLRFKSVYQGNRITLP